MIEICKPGFRCESCPMDDLPPDDQFPVQYDPNTNEVTVRLVGEDAGDTFDLTKRFNQKAAVGTEVGYTVQAGVCEAADGSREEEAVCEIIDTGIELVKKLSSLGISEYSIRHGQQTALEREYGLPPIKAGALVSVIMRMAEV